jgi:hypothetical protein
MFESPESKTITTLGSETDCNVHCTAVRYKELSEKNGRIVERGVGESEAEIVSLMKVNVKKNLEETL